MKIINLPLIATALCFAFFAVPIITPDSYAIAPFLLALFSLFLLPKTYPAFKIKDVRYISLAMSGYFILTIVSLLYSGGTISQLDMPSRTIFAAFILFSLITYKPNPKYIFIAIPIGAMIAGLMGIYHSYYIGGRAFTSDGFMPIQIGGIIASLATLSVISFFYYFKNNNIYLSTFCFIAANLAYLSTILTEARGAWLLTPIILLAIIYLNKEIITKKIIVFILISITAILTISYPQLSSRIISAESDISRYSSETVNTSSGARLEMWKSALYSAREKPIFGQGFDQGLIAAKERQLAQGLIKPVALTYSRAHNQYLEDLQTKGLIGLSILLLMFLIPFRFFLRNFQLTKKSLEKNNHNIGYFLSQMGAAHIALIAGYCLTQHYLAHHSGILFFAVGIAIFSALVINQRSEP